MNVTNAGNNRYINYSSEQVVIKINSLRTTFSAESQKAESALKSSFILQLKHLQVSANPLKVDVVAKEIIDLIEMVEMFRNTTIPTSMTLLERSLQKRNVTAEDKVLIACMEDVVSSITPPIALLDQFSTPAGLRRFFSEVHGLA